jgi:hypothetical protein
MQLQFTAASNFPFQLILTVFDIRVYYLIELVDIENRALRVI